MASATTEIPITKKEGVLSMKKRERRHPVAMSASKSFAEATASRAPRANARFQARRVANDTLAADYSTRRKN
jgi:hypothetical protein